MRGYGLPREMPAAGVLLHCLREMAVSRKQWLERLSLRNPCAADLVPWVLQTQMDCGWVQLGWLQLRTYWLPGKGAQERHSEPKCHPG